MIAIHRSETGFHPRWVSYCKAQGIPFRQVDCYGDDLIRDLEGCRALMWHHSQGNPKDKLVAKPILFALEQAGIQVFPNFYTHWHFDDKVGQKYLLEALGAPLVPTHVFLEKNRALAWLEQAEFPLVWKLRGGAGSQHVKLIRSKAEAKRKIDQAFGWGFLNYDARANLNERWRKYRLGKISFNELLKGIARFGYPPEYARIGGRERGYVYFQDFVPGNDSDIRVIVIDGKAFAMKRLVRSGDFRASGSGAFQLEREVFDERCIRIAFEISRQLRAQCVAFDFVFSRENEPLILEISYGFTKEPYYDCPGYWTEDMKWHEGTFNAQSWMVELVLKAVS